MTRQVLPDGSFIEWSITYIKPDKWRPHGVRYRLAWVQKGVCRVLFDNHHGKKDHCHIDESQVDYIFESPSKLRDDFLKIVRRLGGQV